MAKARINGINMHYQVKGDGPDVVLIHGVTSSLAIWYAKVMPALARSYRVTAYDLRGHGYSELTPSGYTSLGMAEDLLALMDHLGMERARLVGHSYGGSIGLHTALLQPKRVEGVVLGDTGVACLRRLRSIQDWPGWELYKEKIAQYGITYEWFAEAESRDVREVMRRSYDMQQKFGFLKGTPIGTRRIRRLIDESNVAFEFRQVAGMTEERLPEISAPVLAVYGATSPYHKMGMHLAEVLPNAYCRMIPDTGHFYLLEDMDLFLGEIEGFLADPAGYVTSRRASVGSDVASDLAAPGAGRGEFHVAADDVSQRTGDARAGRTRSDGVHATPAAAGYPSKGEGTMSRILLVAPKFDSEFSRARSMARFDIEGAAPQSLMCPLNLATIAALTPDDFEVDIWDEGARGEIDDDTDLGHRYDLVGVTGYIAHIPRALKLADVFHRRNVPVVIGGPGVSGAPEQCRGVFDVIFLGEAELTWPRFLEEWRRGVHRSEYRQVERPDLMQSPAPRWGNIVDDVKRYRLAGVQTTRGCPYDCEFCDVIHLFGRQPRHKPVERVIEEVVALQKLGARRIFMCDDDFIGDKKYTKELLRALIPVNNTFDPPLTYSTQLTIDLAHDEELMELMADCNFTQALIGIETPRTASLVETHKIQNLRSNLVDDCKKIHSYGIGVKAALIVGFDADDTSIFDEQIQFIEDAHVPITTINTMKAYPGTPLWVRLQRENRVVDVSDIYDDSPKVVSNIIPKGMTRIELLQGYLRLIQHARSWESWARRMKAFLSGITRKPNVPPASPEVRQKRMEQLGRARVALESFPDDARTAMTEVLMHALSVAPYMIEHLVIMTMQQAMDHALLPYHGEIIQRQIDMELSGKLRLAPDPSAGMIPKDFKTQVREVMPLLYERLATSIDYRPGVPEAMVAVIKDFLIRWGPTFQRFEDYHQVYLHELCDRHIGRFNGNGKVRQVISENGSALTREQAQSARFITAMLVAVEQEMRGEARSMLHAEISAAVGGAQPVGA